MKRLLVTILFISTLILGMSVEKAQANPMHEIGGGFNYLDFIIGR